MSDGYVCPECGLDYDTIQPPDAKVALQSFPRRYRSALAAATENDAEEGLIRRRPDATTWSALEYTAHVADLFDWFGTQLQRMWSETRPTLDDFDGDARAASERYNDQDPAAVLDDLTTAAQRLVQVLEQVDADSWHRSGVFPFGERDLLAMTRNAVHEGSHHLRDVDKVLEAARRPTR